MSSRMGEKQLRKEYRKSVDRIVTKDIQEVSNKLRKKCNLYRIISN